MDVREPGTDGSPAASGPSTAGARGRSPLRTALEMLGLGPPPPDGHRFHALISYSHATDSRLAAALQRGLQRFARPWYRTRALHVFRDNASLAANPHLWHSVQAGLDDAQHFILLASRDAAASPWVARECAYWRETKSIERLLIVLTDGEIAWDEAAGDFDRRRTTALPGPLYGAYEGEPRWIDMRWAAGERDLTLDNTRFREAIAELGAPLHGLPRDEFDSIEVHERRRAVRLARGATAALALLLVAAVVAAILALQARDEANRESAVARSTALAVQARDAFGNGSALTASRPDLGVLLALESYRLAPTEQARGAVLDALETTDRVRAYLHPEGGQIDDIAYSPDGRVIAVESGDSTIGLWSVPSMRRLGTLRIPAGQLSHIKGAAALSFSPDGKLLALAGAGRVFSGSSDVVVWRVRTRRTAGPPLPGGGTASEAVAFAPSGALVVGMIDGTVHIWNPLRRQDLRVLPMGCASAGVGERLAVSASATIVLGCSDGSVWAWRTTVTGSTPVRLAPPGPAGGADVAISRDGTAIAAGYREGQLTVWTLSDSGTFVQAGAPRTNNDGGVNSLAFSPDGRYVAVAYADGFTRVWTLAGSGPFWYYQSSVLGVEGVAWSPDGRTLAVGGDDGLGVLWKAPRPDTTPPSPDLYRVLDGGARSGGPVAFGPDGSYLAVVGPGGVRLLDPRGGAPLGPPLAGTSGTTRLAAGPGELAVVTAREGAGPRLQLWTVSNPRRPRRTGSPLPAGTAEIGAVTFDRAGDLLAASRPTAHGPEVQLWNVRTRRSRRLRLSALDRPVLPTSLAFDPRAPVLAVGEGYGEIQTVRYAPTAARPRTIVPANFVDGTVSTVAYSRDGSMLVYSVVGGAGSIRLLHASSGTRIGTIVTGQSSYVPAFSPDGALLAVGDTGGRVQLMDVASEEPFGRAVATGGGAATGGAPATIASIAFSPDGSEIAAGGTGPVTLFDRLLWATRAQYAQRRARLCNLVGRNLTRLEWATYLPGQPYRRTCPRWPAGS